MLKLKLFISLISLTTLISLTFLVAPTLAQCPPEAPNCNEPSTPPGNNSDLGTITPPSGTVPTAGGDPSGLVAGIVRNGIWLFIIVAFIIAMIWIVLAGLQFILANGDPKNVSTAWSRIYWGLIGLVVVIASFAIIKIVETFFKIQIISGGFTLPRIGN